MEFAKKLNVEGFELYFKYENLELETFIGLFTRLNTLHEKILGVTSPVYYNDRTQERFRNILELKEINTGQSITTVLNEKWKIELPFGLGRIEGDFPKKLGIPVVITFFLLVAAYETCNIHDKLLEIQLHELEIELKKNELHQQLEGQKGNRPAFRNATREAVKTIDYIMSCNDITYFELNGVPIKNDETKFHFNQKRTSVMST
jgi:hypothetical protein